MRALKPGDQLGRYVLDRPLGAGGMGSVWVAVQEGLGRRVALKVIHATFAMDVTVAARFQREAKIAASFNHPSIVPVTDFGVHEGRPFLVMDLLEGESMDQLLDREGRLSVERCAFLAVQVLAGLEAAHDKGVIHRDLKPDNIFVSSSSGVGDIARLLDFGIARLSDAAAPKMTSTGQVLGTPAYMAPEQAKGLEVDERSDLYSVGVILYEALSGRAPFEASNYHQLMFAIVGETPPPLAELRPDLPPDFVAVVERAMAKSSEERFGSALAMREALLPFARQVPMTPAQVPKAASPQSTTDPFAPTMALDESMLSGPPAPSMAPAKRAGIVLVGVIALVGLGALGMTLALGASPPTAEPAPTIAVNQPSPVAEALIDPEEAVEGVVEEATEAAIEAPTVALTAEAGTGEETAPRVELPGPVETAMRRRTSMRSAMASEEQAATMTRPGYVTLECRGRSVELRVVREGDQVRATFGATNNHVQPVGAWLSRLNARSLSLARCFVGAPLVQGQRVDVVLSSAGRITDASFPGHCAVEPRVRTCVTRVMRSVDYSDVLQSPGPATFGLAVR